MERVDISGWSTAECSGASEQASEGWRSCDTDARAARARAFSVFDLDRTLTRRGTYSPFLLHCALSVAPWRLLFVPLVLLTMLAYKLRLLDRKRLKTMMHALMIGRRAPRETIGRLAESFALRCSERGCYEEAFLLIARERAEGREVVLATAAHRFYAEAIAARLSIGHVIATESRWEGDTLTAGIVGPNCYGPAKCDALAAFLGRRGVARPDAHVRFYSDDLSDLPSFEWADQRFAVNPSARLAAVARSRNWPLWHWSGNATATGEAPTKTPFAHYATV